MSPITPGEILPHFDVRAASVGGKLALLIFSYLRYVRYKLDICLKYAWVMLEVSPSYICLLPSLQHIWINDHPQHFFVQGNPVWSLTFPCQVQAPTEFEFGLSFEVEIKIEVNANSAPNLVGVGAGVEVIGPEEMPILVWVRRKRPPTRMGST